MFHAQLRLATEMLPEGVGLVAAEGYMNAEAGEAIVNAARRLMAKGCSRLRIDLEGTRLVNRHGLSSLVTLQQEVARRGGCLAFRNLTATVAMTFRVAGLVGEVNS